MHPRSDHSWEAIAEKGVGVCVMRLDFTRFRVALAIGEKTGHALDGFVWLMLEESSDDITGETYLSANRIASDLQVTRKRVRASFTRLQRLGVATKTDRSNRDGGGFAVPIYVAMRAEEASDLMGIAAPTGDRINGGNPSRVAPLGIAPHDDPHWQQAEEPPF